MKIHNITIELNSEDLDKFSKERVIKHVIEQLTTKEKDCMEYLKELLNKDLVSLVGAKEAVMGYNDEDINCNHKIQDIIRKTR